MGEVPREVLSTSLRIRGSLESVERAVEDFLEYIRRNNILPSQKVAENVYLVDVPLRGFLRTIREKFILARSVSVATGGARVVSYSDVDNKLVLTISISPESGGYTRVHIACSSLSRLRKACSRLAEILTNMLAAIERMPPTPRVEVPAAALQAAREKEEGIALPREEETIATPEAPTPIEAVAEETITRKAGEIAALEAPSEAGKPGEAGAPFRITSRYADYINETGLVMLILRADLLYRTNLAPGTSIEDIVEKLKKIAEENKGKIIVATFSQREGADMAAIAFDSEGEAALSVKHGSEEARIVDSFEEFARLLSKLLEKPVRLSVYRLR